MYKLDLSPRMIVRGAEVGPVKPTPFGRERAEEIENLAVDYMLARKNCYDWSAWGNAVKKYMSDGEIAYVYAILDALKSSVKIDDYRSILDENKLVGHAFMLIELNYFGVRRKEQS